MSSILDKAPDAVAYIPRILAALRQMDGEAKAASVKEAVVATMAEQKVRVDETLLQSGQTKYLNDMQWSRMYLVNAGMLAPVNEVGRGIWKLTDKGWQAPLDAQAAMDIYNVTAKKGKKVTDTTPAPGDDGQPELIQSWETKLKSILTNLPDKGFERLCAHIMAKNGLHATKVMGQSGDGGVDGEGWVAFDDLRLVSVRVAWQCKRFKGGPIGSPMIRDFRGALNDATNHGIFFATSTFTAEAIQEAAIPGKKLIRLVDLKALIDMLGTKDIGVKTVSGIKEVDEAFFKQYQNPVGDSVVPPLLVE